MTWFDALKVAAAVWSTAILALFLWTAVVSILTIQDKKWTK